MMTITILAIGNLREIYLKEGIREYQKRLTPYIKLEWLEIPEEKGKNEPSAGDIDKILDAEGKRMLEKIRPDSYVVGLDIKGKMLTSEEFSRMIMDCGSYQASNLTFLIGGSWGMSDGVKKRCDRLISFSFMTFPHQLMRLILMEQLYRAFMIATNHQYHK